MATLAGVVKQSAVIPVQGDQICMVLSRGGKRWVVPKGSLEPGKSAGEIALQEAWEEAGLTGILNPDPVGSYCYVKDGRKFYVLVYFMNVTQIEDEFPESTWRERVWVSFNEAVSRIEEYGLQEMIRGLVPARMG